MKLHRLSALIFCMAGLLVALPNTGSTAEKKIIDRAAVIVNNKMMTELELIALKSLQEKEIKAQFKGEEQTSRLRELHERLLERVVENLLLESRADSLDIQVSDKEIDDRVETLLKSDPRIADAYSDQTLRELIVKDLLSKRVLQTEVLSRISVGDDEIAEACRAVEGDARQLDVGHILLRSQKPEAATKLLEIRKKLLAGAKFEGVAAEFSEDPSVSKNKGRLGFVSRGQFVKEFENKAFSMKVGELSEPVRTQFGYHLIKVFGERATEAANCEKLDPKRRRRFQEMIWARKQNERQEKYFSELRAKAEIKILVKQ